MATTNEIVKVFLPWVGANSDGANGPSPEDFVGVATTERLDEINEDELLRAVDRLEEYGLVRAFKTLGGPMPMEVTLTPRGFECVEEYDSDLRAYLDARQGVGARSTTINHSTITMGDHGQASAFTGGDVTQRITEITADPERLLDVSRMAREIVGLLPEHTHDEVREAATELGAAAGTGDAAELEDEDRVRAAAARLIRALTPFAAGITVIRFIIDVLTGALG